MLVSSLGSQVDLDDFVRILMDQNLSWPKKFLEGIVMCVNFAWTDYLGDRIESSQIKTLSGV